MEITAPAGSYECLAAALKAGADSVYFGVGNLNMRARATVNFKKRDLPKIARLCSGAGARAYMALNTIVYDEDLREAADLCERAAKAGISAVIAGDVAVMRMARAAGLEVHVSVQANISNFEAVKFYSQFADVMVLARELRLPQIKRIVQRIRREDVRGPSGRPVKIELFAHGALCVAVSGVCHMSLAVYNSPANRGACLQNCRRAYRVVDEETGDELVLDGKYVMSPRDLCTIGFLDQILDAGVSVLKIEGRGRSADYVLDVVATYADAVRAWRDGSFSKARVDGWMRTLRGAFNRGFWDGGYYLGEKLGEWCGAEGNIAEKRKIYVGRVLNYYRKKGVAEVSLDSHGLSVGDEALVTGPTTGAVTFKIENMMLDGQPVAKAPKGSRPTINSPGKIRLKDKLHSLAPRGHGERA